MVFDDYRTAPFGRFGDYRTAPFAGFGAFGAYYGRSGDPWDQWCNSAADVWQRVSGKTVDADRYRKSCVDCNQAGIGCHFSTEPWSGLGKLRRSLPAEFSSDESITRQGLLGVVQTWVAPPPQPAGPTAEQAAADAQRARDLEAVRTGAISTGGGGGGGGDYHDVAKKAPSALLVVGLGLVGFGVLMAVQKRKRKSVAGYGRYRARRQTAMRRSS